MMLLRNLLCLLSYVFTLIQMIIRLYFLQIFFPIWAKRSFIGLLILYSNLCQRNGIKWLKEYRICIDISFPHIIQEVFHLSIFKSHINPNSLTRRIVCKCLSNIDKMSMCKIYNNSNPKNLSNLSKLIIHSLRNLLRSPCTSVKFMPNTPT